MVFEEVDKTYTREGTGSWVNGAGEIGFRSYPAWMQQSSLHHIRKSNENGTKVCMEVAGSSREYVKTQAKATKAETHRWDSIN